MSQRIFIHLISPGDADSSQLTWLFIDDAGEIAAKDSGSFNDFLTFYATVSPAGRASKKSGKGDGVALIGLLSGFDVTYLHVNLPTRNKQQMWQALPFMVEEFIVSDIDLMALGASVAKAGEVKVSVVQRDDLNRWTQLFEEAGVYLTALYGLPDLLRPQEAELQILVDKQNALLKAANNCWQMERDNLALGMGLESLDAISNIKIFCDATDREAVKLAKKIKIEQEADGEIEVTIEEYRSDALENWLSQSFDEDPHRINLLHVGSEGSQNLWMQPKAWLSVGIAAAVLIVLQIGLNLASGYYFGYRAEKILQSGESYYGKLFPDESINDLQVQWGHKMQRSNLTTNQATFPLLFSKIVDAFSAQSKGKKDVVLLQFRFDAEDGDLRMDIQVKSIAMLDAVKQSALEDGLAVEILSANEEAGSVKSAIRVALL